ncbi:MAG TPA: hypothetical protein VE177_08285 [Candidatus Binatus sp.]|nr:hypothetical protein [Candidatus Binatus sp.]
MTLPIPKLPPSPPIAHSEPPRSFWRWALRLRNKFTWISSVGWLVTAGGYVYNLIKKNSDLLLGLDISTLALALQTLIIFLLLCFLPRHWVPHDRYERFSPKLKLAKKAANDFRDYWGYAWLTWGLLYITLTLGVYSGISTGPGGTMQWNLLLNFFQNCTTVLLLMCYEIIARPTLREDFTRIQLLPKEAWVGLVLLLAVIEGLLIPIDAMSSYIVVFQWISGFAQGFALALLVGRFESKYIEPPLLIVVLLYLYAIIQGAWPAMKEHAMLLLILTLLALALKCLLFLVVSWLLESGVIVFYLSRIRRLDEIVRQDRETFLHAYWEGDPPIF